MTPITVSSIGFSFGSGFSRFVFTINAPSPPRRCFFSSTEISSKISKHKKKSYLWELSDESQLSARDILYSSSFWVFQYCWYLLTSYYCFLYSYFVAFVALFRVQSEFHLFKKNILVRRSNWEHQFLCNFDASRFLREFKNCYLSFSSLFLWDTLLIK